MHIAVIGAGWAGCTAAVRAIQAGAQVSVFETSRIVGGRARSLEAPNTPAPSAIPDNGQHILIGAYTETLDFMHSIGVAVEDVLERFPLDLRTPNQHGLCMPYIRTPQLAVVYAICTAKGWSFAEKLRFLQMAAQWQLQGFRCASTLSVADVCQKLSPRIQQSLIEPLCLAAFNSPPAQTSGAVFLRVLRDALLLQRGGSNVLLARVPFGQILPEAAIHWLQQHQAHIYIGQRVKGITCHADATWHIHTKNAPSPQVFNRVILACPAWEAARLVQNWHTDTPPSPKANSHIAQWAQQARALQHNPIATVYAWGNAHDCTHLPPMQALHASNNTQAQFVFYHPQYHRTDNNGNTQVLLAFVCSYCENNREALQHSASEQAQKQLGLSQIEIIQTFIEKRATFVCSPNVERPSMHIADNLFACGDYISGDYPSTLEGAVRSGLAAAQAACA